MTNGVSVSVIAALLVGPVASIRLERVLSPHCRWDFRMYFPKAFTPVAYQIQIRGAIGKNCIKHAHAKRSHVIVNLSAM